MLPQFWSSPQLTWCTKSPSSSPGLRARRQKLIYLVYIFNLLQFQFFLSLETNQASFKNAFACGSWLSREHHIISKLFFNVPFVHSCLVKEMFYMSCLCSEKLPWVVLRIVCFLPDVVRWNGLLSQLLYVPYLQS